MDGECTGHEGETLIWGTTGAGERDPGQGAGNGVQSTGTAEGSAGWPQRWLLGVNCSVERCWLRSHLSSTLKSQKRHFRRLNFLATFSGGLRLPVLGFYPSPGSLGLSWWEQLGETLEIGVSRFPRDQEQCFSNR